MTYVIREVIEECKISPIGKHRLKFVMIRGKVSAKNHVWYQYVVDMYFQRDKTWERVFASRSYSYKPNVKKDFIHDVMFPARFEWIYLAVMAKIKRYRLDIDEMPKENLELTGKVALNLERLKELMDKFDTS